VNQKEEGSKSNKVYFIMIKNIGTLKSLHAKEPEIQVLSGRLKYPIKRNVKKELKQSLEPIIEEQETPQQIVSEQTTPDMPVEPEITAPNLPEHKYIFNISMPSIEVSIPGYQPPSITVNNDVQPTPLNILPSEVVVQSPVVNVSPPQVIINNDVQVPKVTVNNEIKMQPENELSDFQVVRDEFGNIVGIQEEAK
jgi:hypothetical protein